jgi:hypothetical protein
MSRGCDQQEKSLAAARAGALDAASAVHARDCADCRALLLAEESLRGLALELRSEAQPPGLEGLLWRAELRRRLEGAERGARVLLLYDRVALAAGVAGLGVVLAWKWGAVVEAIGRWMRADSSASLATVLAVAALLVLSLMGWLATLWAED